MRALAIIREFTYSTNAKRIMIDFSLRADHPSNTKTDVVAVAVHDNQKLSWAAEDLDKASKGALKAALKAAAFSGGCGKLLPLFNLPGISATRVLVYGAGEGKALAAKDARATGRALAAAAVELELAELTIFPLGEEAVDAMQQMVMGVSEVLRVSQRAA